MTDVTGLSIVQITAQLLTSGPIFTVYTIQYKLQIFTDQLHTNYLHTLGVLSVPFPFQFSSLLRFNLVTSVIALVHNALKLEHRDLEHMEPKVISVTLSGGGKLVILLHNST